MTLYKHLKRGTIYETIEELFLNTFSEEGSMHSFVIGTEKLSAEFQFSGEGRYAGPVILYRGTDNKYWLRATYEFNDGRFIKL